MGHAAERNLDEGVHRLCGDLRHVRCEACQIGDMNAEYSSREQNQGGLESTINGQPVAALSALTAAQPRHRVLIVDDRAEIRLLLRHRLRFVDDMQVVGEASNGREALDLVKTLAPDAIVLDLEMPVMRGDEAIPLIRAVSPNVRIIMYSGTSRSSLHGMTSEAEPDCFVEKGSPLSELVAQIRFVLGGSPSQQIALL